jgi:peptidoglycan/LPS O-acetylase OafA/YrhL
MTNSANQDNKPAILQRDYTNCLRGISILAIAVLHVVFKWDGMPRFLNLPASVFVAAFIFLSGYGIHESYKKNGLKNYWYKRLKRIILPYTLLITVLIPFTDNFSWKDYLLDITYIHSSYWFIEFIMWNYLVYWVAQRFFPGKMMWVMLLAGFAGLNTLMQVEAEQCCSFAAGVAVSQHIGTIRAMGRKKIISYAAAGFLIGTFFVLLKEIPCVHSYKGTLIYNYILLMIKLPMSLSVMTLPMLFPVMLRSRVLYWLGIGSLEVYLVHMALLDCVEIEILSISIYTAATIVLSCVMYRADQFIMRRL